MRAAGLTSYLVKRFGTDKCIAIVERVLAEARLARYKQASRLYISEGAVRTAEELSKTSGGMGEIRAKEVDATLLFSDMSGFTSMSSKMTPAEVVAILNEAFDALCIVIRDQGGDIDKSSATRSWPCLKIARSTRSRTRSGPCAPPGGMQRALDDFNRAREKPLVMRIGLNAGQVVRGDIGSRFVRRDYICIGDVVNRAQRHESKAPLGGVWMSASVYDRVASHVEAEGMTGLTFKGIDEPQSTWVLKGLRD